MLTLVENNICWSGKAGALKVTKPSLSFSIHRGVSVDRTSTRVKQRRKEALFQRIIKEDLERVALSMRATGRDGKAESSRCIWNNQDIGVHEVEEDRCRMRARLREAVAEAKRKGEERKYLLGLLEEQLGLARQEAAWRTLHKDALQAEGHKISVQLQAQATEAKRHHGEEDAM